MNCAELCTVRVQSCWRAAATLAKLGATPMACLQCGWYIVETVRHYTSWAWQQPTQAEAFSGHLVLVLAGLTGMLSKVVF
jgi:hypothetical protein